MKVYEDLSIAVLGRAGAGKSTVARIIQKALNDAGINAVVRSEDTLLEMLVATHDDRTARLVERLDGQIIEINQTYLPRVRVPQ